MTDDDQDVPTLRQWVGRAVRQLREHNGQRQDDVASSARELGLTWTVSKISALERGDKALPAEELLLLPLVLARAHCGSPTLADLLPNGPNLVDLGDKITLPGHVLATSLEYGDPDYTFDNPVVWRERNMSKQQLEEWFCQGSSREAIRAVWPHMPSEPHDVARAWHGAGEAERVAARRLDVPFPAVLAAAMGTWDRSLTAERDHRVQERVEAKASARSVQAMRGHITRELYREIAPAIDRYRHAAQS